MQQQQIRLFDKLRTSKPFFLVAGLNVLESYETALRTASELANIASRQNVKLVFKASFDKANRSNEGAFRGPGVDIGTEYLARIKQKLGIPIVTDVHERYHCKIVKDAGLDMIQIPAFLCRQTDLLYAAADTELPVLIKKGNSLA
jgi:2-dehydro-3-deoxyphosphooctonate aldolase (KDO 8-P synthase)